MSSASIIQPQTLKWGRNQEPFFGCEQKCQCVSVCVRVFYHRLLILTWALRGLQKAAGKQNLSLPYSQALERLVGPANRPAVT